VREPRLYKKRDHYHAVFYLSETGGRKWYALGTTKQREAEKMLARMTRGMAEGRFSPHTGWKKEREAVLFSDATAAYLQDLREESRTPKSVADMRAFFQMLVRYAERSEYKPQRVDEELVMLMREFYQRLTLSPASRHSYYRRSKAFLNWCARRNLSSLRLLSLLSEPKQRKRKPVYLEPNDLMKLIRHSQQHDPFMETVIRLAYSTGLRLSELLSLRWEDVGDKYIRVVGKGDRERLVPLFPEARQTIERLNPLTEYVLSDRSFTSSYISHRFKRLVRACELSERYRFHSLRHTFASYLAMDGVALDRIRDWMGHESVVMTEVYAQLRADSIASEGLVTFPYLPTE
jgi:integrase